MVLLTCNYKMIFHKFIFCTLAVNWCVEADQKNKTGTSGLLTTITFYVSGWRSHGSAAMQLQWWNSKTINGVTV